MCGMYARLAAYFCFFCIPVYPPYVCIHIYRHWWTIICKWKFIIVCYHLLLSTYMPFQVPPFFMLNETKIYCNSFQVFTELNCWGLNIFFTLRLFSKHFPFFSRDCIDLLYLCTAEFASNGVKYHFYGSFCLTFLMSNQSFLIEK